MPCDGAGKEVVPEAVKVLRAVGADLVFEDFDIDADSYLRTGVAIPDATWKELKAADSILFGAVGDPRVPDPKYLHGVLLRLRSLRRSAGASWARCYRPSHIATRSSDIALRIPLSANTSSVDLSSSSRSKTRLST